MASVMSSGNPGQPKLYCRSPIFGVGIVDVLTPLHKNRRPIPAYRTWTAMIGRCYSPNVKASAPWYKECTCAEEWLIFSNFQKWYEAAYKEGYELDKDLLEQGNKHYSPEKCLLVPKWVNSIATGAPKGYNFSKNMKRWRASMHTRYGGTKILGYYETKEAARKSYVDAKHAHITAHKKELDEIDPRLCGNILRRFSYE